MILLGLFLTAILGWLVLPRRWQAAPLEGLSLGFLLAAFGISAEMFLFSLTGLPLCGWLALIPWAAGAAWMTYRKPPALGGFSLPALLPLAAAVCICAAWWPYERMMPLTSQSWDAWAIWLFKAKAFFLDGSTAPYLARAGEFVGQPGYPLLTPLYSTFLYALAGAVDDAGAKLSSPFFFLAMLGAFHFLARRAAGSLTAGAATAMVALTPTLQSVAFELAGYADTALAAYMVCGAGFAYLAMRDGDQADLAAAALAGTAAAWTKNEGQFFLLGLGAALAAWMLASRRGAKDWAWLAAPPVLLLGLWWAVRSSAAVEAAGFSVGLDFQASLFSTALRTMLQKAFSLSGFNLAFLLLPAAAALGATFGATRAFWLTPALAVWQFLGALLAYSTGRNDLAWWLGTSADRLLSQMAPLCLFAAALAFALWSQAQPAPAPEAPATKRRKRTS
ncbi:MAG: hypothetical protein KDC27_15390 [Acidobacteria bacterium]|nr:hypothetical protein [Acidobacteriota bacterium]